MPKIVKKYGKITLILGLILVLIAMYGLIPLARAASLTKERDTLSDSRPDAIAMHTVIFQATTAIPLSGHVVIDLPDGFVTPAGNQTDVAIYFDANDPPTTACTMAAACDASKCCVTFTPATDTIDITLNSTAGVTAGHYVKVVIGDGAAGGWEDITNPAAPGAVYDVDITTQDAVPATLDTGKAKVAIIAGVEVTATVAESLSFTIDHVIADDCPNTIGGTDQSNDGDHDEDTVSFGTITPETFYFSCQSLAIATNAPTGYTCTVQETDQLKFGATVFPDGDCNGGSCSATSVGLWTTATEGGFGYCMDDVTGNAALTTDADDDAGTNAADWLVANQCDDATPDFKIFPETPSTEAVMKSYTPASDTSYLAYKINALYTQAAGAYSTTTVFVATPTY